MGFKETLADLGVTKRTAPAAAVLIPLKSLMYLFAVSFMVEKLGPIQIQVLGLSLYAIFVEGTGWFLGIIANDIAKGLFGMTKFVDKFLFKTVADLSFILLQVALATIFFIVLQIIFVGGI